MVIILWFNWIKTYEAYILVELLPDQGFNARGQDHQELFVGYFGMIC